MRDAIMQLRYLTQVLICIAMILIDYKITNFHMSIYENIEVLLYAC